MFGGDVPGGGGCVMFCVERGRLCAECQLVCSGKAVQDMGVGSTTRRALLY